MIHELKTWPEYFKDVAAGIKTFELRKNDRDFQVGDELVLKEYDPKEDKYSGRYRTVLVMNVFRGDGTWGLMEGYCIMDIALNDDE